MPPRSVCVAISRAHALDTGHSGWEKVGADVADEATLIRDTGLFSIKWPVVFVPLLRYNVAYDRTPTHPSGFPIPTLRRK